MHALTSPLTLCALLLASPVSLAAEGIPSGPWQETGVRDDRPQLASAGSNATPEQKRAEAAKEKTEALWYGRNTVHKYLGLGSISAAALSMISPKKEGGVHERFAEAAALLGGAAVATGFYAHNDDLSYEWKDPDTRHAAYGALGTLGFALAVSRGGKGGHAGLGALGAVSMIAAIKITW